MLLAFVLLPATTTSMWHAFDASISVGNTECAQYDSDTYGRDWYSNLKLWPGLCGSPHHTQQDQGIVGWRWAVDEVHKRQHPPVETCKSGQKYLIAHEFPYGFGAQFHVWGGMLNSALSLSRILLQSPDEITPSFLKNPLCGNASNLECYFEPWSSCTLEDALGADGIELYRATFDKVRPHPRPHYTCPFLTFFLLGCPPSTWTFTNAATVRT